MVEYERFHTKAQSPSPSSARNVHLRWFKCSWIPKVLGILILKLHTIFATVLKVLCGSHQFSKFPLETLALLCLLSPCSILNKPQTYKYPTTALSSRDAAKTLLRKGSPWSQWVINSALLCPPVPHGAAFDSTMLRLLCPWDFPGKNTGVGCHFLLQRIFLIRHQTHVSCISCIGRRILYHCVIWEAPTCQSWVT